MAIEPMQGPGPWLTAALQRGSLAIAKGVRYLQVKTVAPTSASPLSQTRVLCPPRLRPLGIFPTLWDAQPGLRCIKVLDGS